MGALNVSFAVAKQWNLRTVAGIVRGGLRFFGLTGLAMKSEYEHCNECVKALFFDGVGVGGGGGMCSCGPRR